MLGRSVLAAATNSTTPGFGTKYADPVTLPPAGICERVNFHPSGNAVVLPTFSASPYVCAYIWDTNSGFGARFIPSSVNPGYGTDALFSPDGNWVLHTSEANDQVTAYQWNQSTGFGSVKYAPSVPPGANAYCLDFHPANNAIVIGRGHWQGVYMAAYNWSPATGFGSKLANPAAFPLTDAATKITDVNFHPSGNAVAITYTPGSSDQNKGNIIVYRWSSGFGTLYANPSILANSTGDFVKFSPSGNAVIFGQHAYKWLPGIGFGDKLTTPATFGPSAMDASFTPSGDAVAYSLSDSPFVQAYRWTDQDGFGSKYSNPSTLVSTSSGKGVAFSPLEDAIVLTSASAPRIFAYRWTT